MAARSSVSAPVHSFSRLPSLPTTSRLFNPEANALSSQAQLERLASPSAQSYDIVPPTPPSPTPAGPVPGYQIVRLGRGHNNRLCFTSTVTGIKGLLMLDTGANNTALSNTTYRSLLANAAYKLPKGLPRSVSLNDIRTPLAEATDFYVGKSNLGAVPVCLLPSSYLQDYGRLYDGLFGENILRHYNALIDCGRLMLYLDIDPAKKLNLSTSFVRHGWTRVPMSDVGNDFTVPCVLHGHAFRLIVDTGSPFTNLDRDLLPTAQVTAHDLPVRGGLIGTDVRALGLVDLDQLQIGAYTAADVHMTATSQSLAAFGGRNDTSQGGPIIGMLGGDILANNGAVIDIGNKALYLKHPVSKTKN